MKKKIKKILNSIIKIIVNAIYFEHVNYLFSFIKNDFISEWNKKKLNTCGKGSIIGKNFDITGGECISIGENTTIKDNSSITAWSIYLEQRFSPRITIGDNCGIGERAHITAIESITIGNGVLLGKNVLITDNGHGNNSLAQQSIIPSMRELISKGPVVIEDNVWIGQNSCVLPGVTIGQGAIIAANSVVTKNVEVNTIVAGNPARVIKKIDL